ncbi:MAG: glycogen debranching enzyme N-terminal domain-containing protein [Acidobacteriota bacterium]|nr:glycogen debranching enzyme N-terminal domain-containing protein [Acidobacteriota bacterium]
MIRVGPEICQDPDAAIGREWLEADGLGGFASSTAIGLNTRRYHGLLVAALEPPAGRAVLLSKLEETLVLDGRAYELSANQYPGTIHPAGYRWQTSFRLDPFPVFTWHVEDIELYKSVFLVHGESTVVVQYILRAQGPAARIPCKLQVRPLIAFRDFHNLTHENNALNPICVQEPGRLTIHPYPDLPPLNFSYDTETCAASGDWYHRFQYARERERGLDFEEDLFQPFVLDFDLTAKAQATVIASLAFHDVSEAGALRAAELSRRKAAPSPHGDRFVVRRGEGKSLIAGYHWFGDWGRDTMISLPGLLIGPGATEDAAAILLQFAGMASDGMLPNRFPDKGATPEYNTVDAALWFFEAVRALQEATGDRAAVDNVLPVMRGMIRDYRQGTRFGIRMEPDGLLHSGEPGVQLTWMDARVNGREVTPRTGKAVEIQALWYNALCILAKLDNSAELAELAARAKRSFASLFWNPQTRYLNDVWNDDGTPDASLRPNQLFAIGLPHKIFDRSSETLSVLDAVERDLLTPYGLRTLSPRDPRYRGRYTGPPEERDAAYHQGTVWPWLIGTFVCAYLDAHKDSEAARARAGEWLQPLLAYRDGSGLGALPEIFDGDSPHAPRGALAQAWSMAEVLRAQRRVARQRPAQ